jgi:hypothetical protein
MKQPKAENYRLVKIVTKKQVGIYIASETYQPKA